MKKYFDEFNRDLLQDLKVKLSGELQKTMINLMYPPVGFLCLELNRALAGFSKDTNTISEIIISRNSRELVQLNNMYQKMFNKVLVDQISYSRSVSSHYRSLVTSILTGFRQLENETDPIQAKQHASLLYWAGEGKRGTDERLINKVMSYESYAQLKIILEEYKKQFGKTLEQSLRKELSGDLLRIHLGIVDYIQSPVAFYAKQLEYAMRGYGTDDASLIRILISRSEFDLENIKREYERRFERTLMSAIQADTAGSYKTALLAILG
uniref:Annexin n=1 Tax=Cacopsylla melanoneura TaxID=428564 RepID=A0A8D8VWN8_9HEMI